MTGVEIVRDGASPNDVRRILDALPEWFGVESANAQYVEDARMLPSYVAVAGDRVIAVLLLKRHTQPSAEIHLLAVEPEHHQRGVGSALLGVAELDLAEDGCKLIQVKTLGPSDPDESYARTRRFYSNRGFLPLEERLDVWPDNPCLIMVKPLGQKS